MRLCDSTEKRKYNATMKISNNTSRQGIRWRWNFFRLVALSLVLAAFWCPNHVGELIGMGFALLFVAYVSKTSEEDLLIEVFDDGDRLRFALDDVRISVSLTAIEKAVFQNGGDGCDSVTVSTFHATPFGRHVRLLPDPNLKFQGNPKRWFDDLEKRICDAKAGAREDVIGDSDCTSHEPISVSGQIWM